MKKNFRKTERHAFRVDDLPWSLLRKSYLAAARRIGRSRCSTIVTGTSGTGTRRRERRLIPVRWVLARTALVAAGLEVETSQPGQEIVLALRGVFRMPAVHGA